MSATNSAFSVTITMSIAHTHSAGHMLFAHAHKSVARVGIGRQGLLAP